MKVETPLVRDARCGPRSFLYGLSMDYEVFVLARMREAYDGSELPRPPRRLLSRVP